MNVARHILDLTERQADNLFCHTSWVSSKLRRDYFNRRTKEGRARVAARYIRFFIERYKNARVCS